MAAYNKSYKLLGCVTSETIDYILIIFIYLLLSYTEEFNVKGPFWLNRAK